MMFLRSILMVCALSPVVTAAERPTQEQLRKAVEESKAEYLKKNAPPTKEDAIKDIQERIDDFRNSDRGNFSSQREYQKFIARKKKELPELKKKLQDVKKNYVSKKIEPRLLDMKWQGDLKIGTVGRVGPIVMGDVLSGEVEVLQVTGKSEFLGIFEAPFSGRRGERMSVGSGRVLFRGIDTANFIDGRSYDIQFDGVITGRFTYETVGGGSKTIPVVEKFDPDHLENWK